MDFSLRCNNHKPDYCRKQLQQQAVITSCAHAFCMDCIKALGFRTQSKDRRKCPACDTALPRDNDAIITELRPSEEYKNTALSGLDPQIIMECTNRALSFWNYQMSTEIAWQQHLVNATSEKYGQLNSHAKDLVREANSRIEDLHKEIEALTLEKVEIQAKSEELANMYKAKSKHCHELAARYDSLMKKLEDEHSRGAATISAENTLLSMGVVSRPETFAGLGHGRTAMRINGPVSKRYMPIEHHGVEQLHPFQRSGSIPPSANSSDIAAQLMPPPPTMRRNPRRDSLHSLGRNSTPGPQSRVTLNQPGAQRGLDMLPHSSGGKIKAGYPVVGLGLGLSGRMKSSGPFG